MEKIDAKTRYRAGRIFDGIGQAMRSHQAKMEAARKEYVVCENGRPKTTKENNVIWNSPTAQADYADKYKAEMAATIVKIKSHPLDFVLLEKIETLTGQDLVALEIVSDNVPKVA